MTQQLSQSEKYLRFFSKFIATPTFAIGSSITTTVAASSIGFIAALPILWLWITLGLIFVAEATVSIYIFKNSVPDTLVACFIHRNIFKNISPFKKGLMGTGILAAVGSGLAFGAVTFVSSTSALPVALALVGVSCPPLLGFIVAGTLFGSAMICLSCLFIKYIEGSIRNNVHFKVYYFFKNNFTRDATKPLMQQILEVSCKLLFVIAIVAMTLIGTIATLGTIQSGLAKFLSLVPQADKLAISIASSVIAYSLMGPARLPWLLSSACSLMSCIGEILGKTIYKIGHNICVMLGFCNKSVRSEAISANPVPEKEKNSWKTVPAAFLKLSAAVIHGFCFGALARSGGSAGLAQVMHVPVDMAEMLALVGQGSAQMAVSTHTFFGQKPVKKEPLGSALAETIKNS